MPSLQEMEPYRIKDQYHSQGRTIRVIHVGAGAAGLLTAYKMKKLFTDYELVCYEK
jgi:cation diffusion facilitator CzcD-associated flavoprotein CzcO